MTEHLTAVERLPDGTVVRHPGPPDHARLQTALSEWWGGLGGEAGALQRRLLVPRLFLEHFANTSYIAEDDCVLKGFLVGFLSQTELETAYIHFVGVRPELQRSGLGSVLYHRFFDLARSQGRARVRCITSPTNHSSVAYHTCMGFRMEPGDRMQDGVPVHVDYDGPGLDRVSFVRDL